MTATDSKSHLTSAPYGAAFDVAQSTAAPSVLLVCEHASNHIPDCLGTLGLTADARRSHIAWDPGALGVAQGLMQNLPATLVSGRISRLVYDCNRPPMAATAIPEVSEAYQIPGNQNLTPQARDERVTQVHDPFHNALAAQIKRHKTTLTLMVTIHSFTPVFNGTPRAVEIGILHGHDDSFAQAMMHHLPTDTPYDTRLNEPYSAQDGVAHTLDEHGAKNDLANVMIEIRNDLIQTPEQQNQMAQYLARWIGATLDQNQKTGGAA